MSKMHETVNPQGILTSEYAENVWTQIMSWKQPP